jgi:predicted MPP superfamily phosphohydrolase
MGLFLAVVMIVYTGMHLLVFWGMHPLLSRHLAVPTLAWVWFIPMIFAPVAVRLLERGGYEASARALAWVGYSWMGFLFLAFCLFVIVAALSGAAWLLPKVFSRIPRIEVHGALSASLAFLIALGAGLFALYEANHIRVERVVIPTDKLAPGAKPIRIAQISDLHLGLMHREEALAPVVVMTRDLAPDLVLATGDVVDAQIDHLMELSSLWDSLDPPLGKYAILGNHEFYAGVEPSLEFLRKSDFKVLRYEAVRPGGLFTLAGVDDPDHTSGPVSEQALLIRARRDAPGDFVLLAKHRPLVGEGSDRLFDLQLSGHTHKGQIYPFTYLSRLMFPMQAGLFDLAGGGRLYTSRGTGTWGPPMRLGSPPEITLFEIVPK